MLLACEYKTEAQQRMERTLGLNEYVSGFSVVLGVYMFGAQGVVFGPGIVCGVKLLYELGGVIILEYTSPPVHTPSDGRANGQAHTSDQHAGSTEAEEASLRSGAYDLSSRNSLWSAARRGALMRRLSFLGHDLLTSPAPPPQTRAASHIPLPGFLSPPTTRRSASAPLRASPPLAEPSSPARSTSPPLAAEAAEAAEAAAAQVAAAEAVAEAVAVSEASPEVSPDLPRPPPANLVGRTLTRSTETFSILDVAVRLVGRGGGACVRVPIRRSWSWSICLAEVQSRLLEASAIDEDEQVTALRATAPPHARVVRATDLAPGEVLEALLRAAGGSAAEASPRGSAHEDAEMPRAALAPPRFDEVASLLFGEKDKEEEEASNLVQRRHIKSDVE